MAVPYDPYNLKAKHSVEEYKKALLAHSSRTKGPKKYLEILRANYWAPDHKITAGDMAARIGYANWSAANLQYGKYAGAIAELLGHTRGKLEGIEVPVTPDVAILVSFTDGVTTGELVQWQLLPAVVQALEDMKWQGLGPARRY